MSSLPDHSWPQEFQLSLQQRLIPAETLMLFWCKKALLTLQAWGLRLIMKQPDYLLNCSPLARVWRIWPVDPRTLPLQSASGCVCDKWKDQSYLHVTFQGIWAATHDWTWPSILQECFPREQHKCPKEPSNKRGNAVPCSSQTPSCEQDSCVYPQNTGYLCRNSSWCVVPDDRGEGNNLISLHWFFRKWLNTEGFWRLLWN